MRVFRRRSQASPDVPDQDGEPAAEAGQALSANGSAEEGLRDYVDGRAPRGSSQTPAKGRPTPKRSEAEKRRRQPYSAPSDRKAAAQQSRTRERATRAARYEAVKRGEDWALPRKDRGPVRALARDYVDSRRRLSEYYMFALAFMLVLLIIPAGRVYFQYLVLLVLAVIIGEGYLVGRRVMRLAQQRFPGESTRGLRMYAAIRCTQFRKLRWPRPRIGPGGSIS
jgi:hypothetical protein